MYVPANINELLDERIQFCESVLNRKTEIPDCDDKKKMIEQFEVESKNFREIKRLLLLIANPETADVNEIRQQFYTAASEMMNKLISSCRQQLENVSDLLTIHQMLNLIEALNKINQQITYI